MYLLMCLPILSYVPADIVLAEIYDIFIKIITFLPRVVLVSGLFFAKMLWTFLFFA